MSSLTLAGPPLANARPTSSHALLLLPVEGMVSPRSEQAIEATLAKLPGVTASASYAARQVKVEFDRAQCAIAEIVLRLDALGLRVLTKEQAAERAADALGEGPAAVDRVHAITDWIGEYRKVVLAGLAGLFLLAGWIVYLRGGPQWLRILLDGLCYVTAGWYTAKNTIQTLRLFRFDIDLLMFVAAIGAAFLGKYEEGAMLLLLFAIGNAGEEMAMDRARRAIHALAKLAPETATVRDAIGVDKLVKVEALKAGDRVVIRPFDRVPADGVVAEGASSIDQAPITGESVPVEKAIGSPVFAGTINGEGLLVATVTKLSSESTLAKVVRLVSEAQTTKSPTQLFTAKIERYYVPAVLIATALLIALPPLIAGGQWGVWFYNAMAFLTAASPCALAIGTPAAVLSGIARAARMGVLFKGGAHLENFGRVTAIAFDKTGTLTRGRPAVTAVTLMPDAGVLADELLALAAAVEAGSSHPLAKAIVDEAVARSLTMPSTSDSAQIPAKGLTATIDGRKIIVGRADWVAGGTASGAFLEAVVAANAGGQSVAGVGIDGRPAGLIALADQPRQTAADAIGKLKHLGIKRTIMLTGDNEQVAQAVGKAVGVDEVHAGLLPEDKSRLVGELQSRYGVLAMIGDGVNDAPAMALATVGVAMGGAGTDVALEAADVALMADDLLRLPDAVALSRASRRIIKENLVIALGVIGVVAPLAAMGFLPLGLAVVLHEGSTVVVVLNSLRLLAWKPIGRNDER